MKCFSLFFLCLMMAVTSYAQQDTVSVNKFYFSREQVISDSPVGASSTVSLIKRDVTEILLDDGNTYMPLHGKGSKIKSGDLKKKIWAVGRDTVLYLNGVHITKTKGYMKAETRGKYILMMTSLPADWDICQQLGILDDRNNIDMVIRRAQNERSGISGNITGGSPLVVKGHKQYPIVYDILTGNTHGFTETYVETAFKVFPSLREKYEGISLPSMSYEDKIAFVNDMNNAYEASEVR